MWDQQMRSRCPDHIKIGKAVLQGYQWIITSRGYASIVSSREHRAEGILFHISESDESTLDRHEGVNSGMYYKADVQVLWRGELVTAMTYIDPITEEGVSKEEYTHRIRAAVADAGLSAAYVRQQISRFIPVES